MASKPVAQNDYCDGDGIRSIFAASALMLERNVTAINALNVFPVPDGDTGTNMLLTLRDTNTQAANISSKSTSEVAAAMARGALLGARGNSGVILSQFFKGMARSLEGKERCTGQDLAAAFQEATQWAYKAVGKPVEGTILTVMKEAALAAQRCAANREGLVPVWEAACEAAREAVALTPTQLPVLRQAGVVDAGGQGFLVMLEGAVAAIKGKDVRGLAVEMAQPLAVPATAGIVSEEFLAATEEELYGYCTQFLIHGQGLDVERIRETMAAKGESAVVVGDDTLVKVHVHTEDPGTFLSYAVSQGSLSQVKIDNIDEQHQEFRAARRKEIERLPVAIVPVLTGAGLEAVFRSGGASAVVPGGDTMNPSVQEILNVTEMTPAQSIILLPNNPNIVHTAEQTGQLSKKPLRVVPALSIPQGVAALLAFNPELDLEENLSRMNQALTSVRSGQICTAIRPTTLGDMAIEEGQLIGFLDGELVAVGDDSRSALVGLLRKAEVAEGDLITLYSGCDVGQEEADEVAQVLSSAFPGVEVEVVSGGQPHYYYIVSIE